MLSSLKKSIFNAPIYARAECDDEYEFIQFQRNNVSSKGMNVRGMKTRKLTRKILPRSFKKSITRQIIDLEKTFQHIVNQLEMNAYMLKVIGNKQRKALNTISSCLEQLCKDTDIIHHIGEFLPTDDLFTEARQPPLIVELRITQMTWIEIVMRPSFKRHLVKRKMRKRHWLLPPTQD